MGVRHAFGRGLASVTLAGCGAAGVLAIQAGLYASALVLTLLGLWLTARAVWPRRPSPSAPPARPPAAVESELRLARSLIDQTPAPLIIAHPGGVIEAGNRAARRLFGVDERRIAPQADLLAAMGESDPTRRLTVTLRTPDGPHVHALSRADLIGHGGELRLGVLIDIHAEIRAAEAAALRDTMQLLCQEIMNALTPLTSLASSAMDLLSEETSLSARRAADAIATLARRADGLIRFVVAYRTLSRLPTPAPANVGLLALLDEAARVFRARWSSRGVTLNVVAPSSDVVIDVDLDLMVQALTNVLSNGAEAALEARRESPSVTLSARMTEAHIELIIQDNGQGVGVDPADAVFRPFFTTKPGGSGVGLTFARQVAQSHGAKLTLAPPEPGQGATFVLALAHTVVV